LKAGEKGLKAHASDLQEQTEKEIKELKAVIGELQVRKICNVLGYNRSNMYYTEKPRKKHEQAYETWLVDEVRKVIEEFPEYGTRRITAILRRRYQKPFNHKKIHRIVKEHCWQRWKRSYGNRPRVQGSKSVTPQANSRWAIDITHLFTKQDGWCHLVAVIDCGDRYLVGWRFSRSGKAIS